VNHGRPKYLFDPVGCRFIVEGGYGNSVYALRNLDDVTRRVITASHTEQDGSETGEDFH